MLKGVLFHEKNCTGRCFNLLAHSDTRQYRHSLWLDLEKEGVLVSEGWGVAFAALRLWALELSDGREMASSIC